MSARSEPSDEPLAKRQKLHTEVQRSTDFWFKEGRFVLVASQKVAYRLHGDVLARQSKVFSDLLSLDDVPRPDGEDTLDGCPIVHITDAPEDFDIFLGLLYDGFKNTRRHVQEPRWATVRVMMLFGDKYDVPEMRAEGLHQLHAWYAADIDAWDKRDPAFFAHKTAHLAVARITRALGDLDLHAAVLYHCCRLPVSQLVAGDPGTGCPPLCADDLVDTLAYLKGMCCDYAKLASAVWDDLDIAFLRCATCRLACKGTLPLSIDYLMNIGLEKSADCFLDISASEELSRYIRQEACEECLERYTGSLQLMRQGYRESLVRRFKSTSRLHNNPQGPP